MNNHNTPVYICSLDAQKCFDSIWHDVLFHKVSGHLSDLQWIFLYKWYISSKAQVRWADQLSNQFNISKGILSPRLFSIFINDLLSDLQSKECGVQIHNFMLNLLAYVFTYQATRIKDELFVSNELPVSQFIQV